jgi:Transglutaminase-like superfamily
LRSLRLRNLWPGKEIAMNLVTQEQAQKLRLAPHVHACRSNDQVILLDLRRDKYLGVAGPQIRALAAAVDGWPKDPVVVDQQIASADLDLGVVAKGLLRQGLLTDKSAASERLPTVSVSEAIASLGEEDATHGVRIGPRRLFWFLQSVSAAAASLRCRSLLSVVRAVAARREGLAESADLLSLDAARNAVAAYEKLRPLVFTSRDKCLFDSLALVNFLAHEDIFPRWVIGVKTGPFGAHSWVQSGHTVLNDLHENVRQFTPILAV